LRRWPTANSLTSLVGIGHPTDAATPGLLDQVPLFSHEHSSHLVRTRPIPGRGDAAVGSDKISGEPVVHPTGNDPKRPNVILRLRQQARHNARVQNRALVAVSHASIIPWGQPSR
jgi:hypothetical protein